jgi:hypothetical protein
LSSSLPSATFQFRAGLIPSSCLVIQIYLLCTGGDSETIRTRSAFGIMFREIRQERIVGKVTG